MARRRPIFTLLLLLTLALGACRPATPTSPAATITPPADAVSTATAIIPVDATPEPSPSPTAAPAWWALIAPPGSDPALSGEVQGLLSKLAADTGYLFQVLPSLSPEQLDGSLKAAVVLPPDPGVAALAAGAPGTHFLAVGIDGLQPQPNLTVASAASPRPDQTGFLAGYIAAVITKDWRVGMVLPAGDQAAQAARQGFVNGVVYFCGLCRPAYPPFYEYPQVVEVAAGAGQADQQAAADYLVDHGVQTVFVAPQAGDDLLLETLAKAGVNIISSASPPPGKGEELAAHWVATLSTDMLAGVRQALPALVDEPVEAGQAAAISIQNINEELFSTGRQRLVLEILSDLQAGYIDTGIAQGGGAGAATPTP